MATASLLELDQRIAIVRDNIRELTEQAAALSGAEDETRIADRIADQERLLAELLKERVPSQIASHDLLATGAQMSALPLLGWATPFSNSCAGARLPWRRLA
jgi:hypothetical protein